jgi:hypothetical protein
MRKKRQIDRDRAGDKEEVLGVRLLETYKS